MSRPACFKGGPWDGREEWMEDSPPDDWYVAEWPDPDLVEPEAGLAPNLCVPYKRHRYARREDAGRWVVYVHESLLTRDGA